MLTDQRNFGLDLIRAVAIMLVLLAHFAKEAEAFGFWGVELFFALSGFLIGQIIWRSFSEQHAWPVSHVVNFWQRRWWRTLPNYYLFFVLTIPLHVYIFNYVPDTKELVDSLWFGQNMLSRNSRFYGVSWSLCIEEWFYILFPLTLLGISKFFRGKRLAFLLTIAVFIAGSLLMRYFLIALGRQDTLRTITLSRLDSIAYGVLIAFVNVQHFMNRRLKAGLFIAGVLLVLLPVCIAVLGAVPYASLRQNPILLSLVPFGSAMIIPALSSVSWPTERFRFFAKWIENISLWSYSIYLSHMPVMFFVYELLSGFRGGFAGNILSKLAGFAVTIALSALVYRYFEIPMLRKRPRQVSVRVPVKEVSLSGNI